MAVYAGPNVHGVYVWHETVTESHRAVDDLSYLVVESPWFAGEEDTVRAVQPEDRGPETELDPASDQFVVLHDQRLVVERKAKEKHTL